MSGERTPLDAVIRARIARDGPMPIATFMALCLYDPDHGYYLRGDPLGAAGDFVTAPEVSQMFGEMIGLWAAEVWQEIGAPLVLQLIEIGPGRGTMMLDAIRAARAAPEFRRALRVQLIEVSPALRQRQVQTLRDAGDVPVRWHPALAEVPAGPAIVLANEFFDALPVHQAERRPTGWHERRITVNAGDELAFTLAPEPMPGFERHLPGAVAKAPVGAVFEWRADRFATDLASRVCQDGVALVVDYGHAASAAGDTFQAVRSHRYASPLATPGRTDLTAHVDFAALGRAATAAGTRTHGPVEQGVWLKRIGIETRARALAAAVAEDKRPRIAADLTRLVGTGSTDMGSLFKAMAISAPHIAHLPGFRP
jgi:NADH dehydrogenase [ubiquinone] 1 alpha subcomplex assembly factor 7